MLRAADLAAVRGDRRLFQDLGFSLEPGELLYVNGPNGSGKTTLLRMLCGLVTPSEGSISWQGADIGTLGDAYRAALVYLGHQNAIKEELTALENLRIGSRLAGVSVSEDEASEALGRMGLHGLEELPTQVLSQGQKRRVGLARLLLTRAPLWVLDEPFNALDAAAVELLQAVLREHLGRDGVVVLTTHQQVAIDTPSVKQIGLGS